MKTINTDVLIIGAGAAGSALALMLRQHAPERKVVMVDKANLQAARIGETLPPGIRQMLEPLGVWAAFEKEKHSTAVGTSAVWGDPIRRDNAFLFQSSASGWRIDKSRFNQFLLREAIRRGAQVKLQHVAKFHERNTAGFQFTLQPAEGEEIRLQTAFVVDASGRTAAFAQKQGAQKVRYDRLTAVWATYSAGRLPDDPNSLVETSEEGWWYSALFPENRLVAAFMTDADLVPAGQALTSAWKRWLQAAPHSLKRLTGVRMQGELQVSAAATQYSDLLQGRGWLAVGDAAGTYDPLSSQGTFKALKSAILGAYALTDYLNGQAAALEKYELLMRQEYETHLELRTQFYQKEQRWAEAPFWQRRYDWLSLHPHTWLLTEKAPEPDSQQASYYLSRREMAFVLEACQNPLQAQSLVKAYRHSPWSYKSDRNIIAGIQFLLNRKTLRCVTVPEHSNSFHYKTIQS